MTFLPKEWKKSLRRVDDRRLLYIAASREEAELFATAHFVTTAIDAIEQRRAFYVALAGGATPQVIYSKLATSPYRDAVDWKKIHLFWSDERSVPPTDLLSNYRMAMTAGLATLPLLEGQIHRMHGEEEPHTAADSYNDVVAANVPDAIFDMIMLGMGDDGHTASLFPGSEALAIDDRLIVANESPVAKPRWRLTMTLPCLNQARQAVFYVLGGAKAPMLQKVLEPIGSGVPLPAQCIGSRERPALWIVDKEAAGAL